MPGDRGNRIAGMSKEAIIALLKEEPGPAPPPDPALDEYRKQPPALTPEEYKAWLERVSQQRPEDTE